MNIPSGPRSSPRRCRDHCASTAAIESGRGVALAGTRPRVAFEPPRWRPLVIVCVVAAFIGSNLRRETIVRYRIIRLENADPACDVMKCRSARPEGGDTVKPTFILQSCRLALLAGLVAA